MMCHTVSWRTMTYVSKVVMWTKEGHMMNVWLHGGYQLSKKCEAAWLYFSITLVAPSEIARTHCSEQGQPGAVNSESVGERQLPVEDQIMPWLERDGDWPSVHCIPSLCSWGTISSSSSRCLSLVLHCQRPRSLPPTTPLHHTFFPPDATSSTGKLNHGTSLFTLFNPCRWSCFVHILTLNSHVIVL